MNSKSRSLIAVALVAATGCAALLYFQQRTLAQSTGYGGRAAGAIAAQLAGRALVSHDQSVQMVGYFTTVPGLPELFHSGGPGEGNACLTFRSSRFRVDPVGNGNLVHLFSSPVEGNSVLLDVYYDPSPDQDFARPETFSDGTKVAVFRVHSGMTTAIPPAYGVCYTSLELVSAVDFEAGNVRVNIGGLGRGGTLNFLSSPPELSGNAVQFPFAIPFGGSVSSVQ